MINRILIRIKVVQLLYSYLLTRSDFQLLPPEGDDSSNDARFAYTTYLNILLIITKLAGLLVDKSCKSPLSDSQEANLLLDNKIARAIYSNPDFRLALKNANIPTDGFDDAISHIYHEIIQSSVYQDYRKKKRHDLNEEVKLWSVIISTIFATDASLRKCAKRDEQFSLQGWRRGMDMAINTITEYADTQNNFSNAKRQLTESLDKAYDLYRTLLMLPTAITRLEEERIEAAKEKYCPTDEELNPNLKFVNNRFAQMIGENPDMQLFLKKNTNPWDNDYYMLKELLDAINASDIYTSYMQSPHNSLAEDCELWRNLLRAVVFPSDALAEALEGKSVYWNDDLHIMGSFVLKTIKQIATTSNLNVDLLPQFKDEEDSKFGSELFLTAIKHKDDYRSYIDKFINENSWDTDRLAFMDIVILLTAITELIKYPEIPIAVTMNEYVEIANYYSTPRSGQFINGILFSISNFLRNEGKICK